MLHPRAPHRSCVASALATAVSAQAASAPKSADVFARSASTERTCSRSPAPPNTRVAPSSSSLRSLSTYLRRVLVQC